MGLGTTAAWGSESEFTCVYVVQKEGRLDEVTTTWNEVLPRLLEFVGCRYFFPCMSHIIIEYY